MTAWHTMPMDSPARTYRATYRDIENAPPGVTAEIVNGELYMHAKPVEPHIEASMGLVNALWAPFQKGRGGPGGWWIRAESQVSFSDPDWRTVAPDLSGWRKDRVKALPTGYFDTRPDWVCEILSPSTRLYDRETKGPVYAEEGIGHFWIVDPIHRTVECLENVNGRWLEILKVEGEGQVSLPPFEAVSFDIGDLWLPVE